MGGAWKVLGKLGESLGMAWTGPGRPWRSKKGFLGTLGSSMEGLWGFFGVLGSSLEGLWGSMEGPGWSLGYLGSVSRCFPGGSEGSKSKLKH